MSIIGAIDSQHGEVSYRTESTEALPDDTPFAILFGVVGGQTAPDRFAVPDNVVRTEMLQVLGLLYCIPLQRKGASCDSRTETSATLV